MHKGHFRKLFTFSFLFFSFLLVPSSGVHAINNSINTPAVLTTDLGKIPDGKEDLFYNNNIMFYEWCPDSGDSGSNCVPPTGDQITWLGDSYSCGAKDEIIKQFPGVDIGTGTCGPHDNNIQGSKHFGAVKNGNIDASFDFNSDDPGTGAGWSGLTLAKKLVDEGKMRKYLVFAFGTNDSDTWNIDVTTSINKLIEIVGENTNIILTTAYTTNGNDYTKRNEAYSKAAEEHGNITVADWASVAKTEYYSGDSVHPTSNGGYAAWVDTIKKSLPQSCNGTGLLEGKDNAEKTWNYFVKANIPGLSDNGAAIAGILGNLRQESGINPFSEAGIYGDLSGNLKNAVISAGISWGDSSQDANDKALTIELDYLVQKNERFYGGGWAESWGFLKSLDKVDNQTPEAYSDLFEVTVEGAVTSNQTSPHTGDSNYIEDSGVRKIGNSVFGGSPGGGSYYQEAGTRRKYAREFFNQYSSKASNTSSSVSTSSGATSSITWDDEGWITGGISGYKKDPTTEGEGDFETKTPKGDIGPNKITLHSTEGNGSNWNSALGIYSCGAVCSAHFTINIKDKQIYQHHSIMKHSGALYDVNDVKGGIQFEIVGLSGDSCTGNYCLKDYSDSDWDYLASVLIGISAQTGIPLTSSVEWKNNGDSPRLDSNTYKNFEGILGHMHAPNPPEDHIDPGAIWDKVSAAISRGGGDSSTIGECGNGDDNNKKCISSGKLIADQAKKLAWEDSNHLSEIKPDYKTAAESVNLSSYGKNLSEAQDCGHFASVVIRSSGVDPDFPSDGTGSMESYMENSDLWKSINNTGNESDLQPGDIFIVNSGSKQGADGHIYIYIGDSKVAGASMGQWTGYIQDGITWSDNRGSYKIFRTQGGDNCNLSGGLTDEQAQKLADYYNSSEVKVTGFANKNNCVGFSAFFVSWLTDLSNPNENPTSGDGYAVAGNLISEFNLSKSEGPKAFSVFSTTPDSFHSKNHTGVVVRVNEDGTATTIESACNNSCNGGDGWGRGFPDGAGNAVVWTNQTLPNLTYAYFSDHMNSKLNEIINR